MIGGTEGNKVESGIASNVLKKIYVSTKTRLSQMHRRLQIMKDVVSARAEEGLNNWLLKTKRLTCTTRLDEFKLKINENRRRKKAFDSKLQAIEKKLRRLKTKQRRDECTAKRRTKKYTSTHASCITRGQLKATLKRKMNKEADSTT